MKLSVIIPTYNDDDRLQLCIDALASQSLPPSMFEVLIINNAPDDLKVRLPGSNFQVLAEATPGSYAARNLGLRNANGDVLAFTDSDCIPSHDWLERGLECLEGTHHARAAGHIELLLNSERPTSAECYESIFAFNQAANVRKGVSVTANMFVRRDVFEIVGSFNDTLLSGGDTEWGVRASRAGFSIVLCSRAKVSHPARSTWSELRSKVMRTTGGKLSNNPDYDLSLIRSHLPPMKALKAIRTNPRAGLRTKFLAFLVSYRIKIFRYYYLRKLRSHRVPFERT